MFSKVHAAYLAHFFGDEIADIDAQTKDIDALAAAVQLVWTKLYGASGMTETQFKNFWATLELAADRS